MLHPVSKDDIQEQLIERLQEEKRQEALRRKERNEAHLFINVNAYTEDSIFAHKGIDLINVERTPCLTFKVNKNGTYQEAIQTIAEQMNYPPNGVRLWLFVTRNNHSYRPSRIEPEAEICSAQEPQNCCVFIETIEPKSPNDDHTLPPISNESKLFFV